MKIDRLMGITLHLLKYGKTSASQLANKFEVNTRTIMRDIDTLCQAGIPITSVCGVNGGYEILETYVLDRHLANEHDYKNIICALRSMASAYENKAIQETIDKITLLVEHEEAAIELDLEVVHENVDTNYMINVLEKAINDKRTVQFLYTNNANEIHTVSVEPVGVVYKWYNWYLIGYNTKYGDYRMYKLVRMEALSVMEQGITMEHSLNKVMEEWQDTQKSIEIKAVGCAQIKAKCREYLNIKITKEFENGDFEIRLHVPENETFWFGVLLSFGKKVKVLEPQGIVNKMKQTCEEVLKIYKEQEWTDTQNNKSAGD